MSLIPEETKAAVRRFLELREQRDEAKKAAEKAEEEYREAEAHMHEALEDTSLPIDVGEPWGRVTLTPKSTRYAKIINRDKALDWLESRAMVDETTHVKIVSARANEIVREAYDNGEPMPPGFDFYTREYVQITRKKS